MMGNPSSFCSAMDCDTVYNQTLQTLKNGEIALKLRRSYINASKYALVQQFLKMSLEFGIIWDHPKVCFEPHMSRTSFFD